MQNSLGQVLVTSPETADRAGTTTPPTIWSRTAVSREVARFWTHWTLEPEVGDRPALRQPERDRALGGAVLPLPRLSLGRTVMTTFAVSTGLNWASEVTQQEDDRAHDGQGHAAGCIISRRS